MGNKQNKNENKHFNKNMHIKSMNELKKDKNSENKDKDRYKFNILFIGESGIGAKTSLIKRLIEGKFIELKEQEKRYEKCENLFFEKEDKKIILYLIDTNGKKERRNFVNDYFQNADCIIMGYNVTNEQNFQEIVDYWYKKVQELSKTNLIYLLGNKIDLQGDIKVREEEAKIFADSKKIKYFPISVKNNINIDEFLYDLKANLDIDKHIIYNNGINEIFYGNPSKKTYRIVFLGECAIGSKSTLINVLVYHKFDYSSACNGSCLKVIDLKNDKKLTLDLWDTPGQEKYKALCKFYILMSDVIVLGYDVTRRETYDSVINFWFKEVKEYSNTSLVYLLGNKIDLVNERNVPRTEARNFCEAANVR